jgi:hypothetical protein
MSWPRPVSIDRLARLWPWRAASPGVDRLAQFDQRDRPAVLTARSTSLSVGFEGVRAACCRRYKLWRCRAARPPVGSAAAGRQPGWSATPVSQVSCFHLAIIHCGRLVHGLAANSGSEVASAGPIETNDQVGTPWFNMKPTRNPSSVRSSRTGVLALTSQNNYKS